MKKIWVLYPILAFLSGCQLSIINDGGGSVVSSSGAIQCGSICSAEYNTTVVEVLSASAESGYVFHGWSGACSGTDNCEITMGALSANKTVTAHFTPSNPGGHTVSVLHASAPPLIADAPDQRVLQGQNFEYNPQLLQGEHVHWSKVFGPDDIDIDPLTGSIHWSPADELASESIYIGVKAENSQGIDYDTFVLTIGNQDVVYIGANETFTNTLDAFDAYRNQPGTTFIYRDGIYADANQQIAGNTGSGSWNQEPPNGNSSAYTTVMAENPSQAIFLRDINIRYLSGTDAYHHIAIKGFYVQGTAGQNNGSIACITDRHQPEVRPHHIKFMYNGVWSEGPTPMDFGSCADGLMEGNYVFGGGRYKMAGWHADRLVMRRNVVRYDRTDNGHGEPKGGYAFYSTHRGIGQNNIMIDSDQPEFWTQGQHAGAFTCPVTSGDSNIAFHRSLLLNSDLMLGNFDRQNYGPCIADVNDMAAWDIRASVSLVHTRGAVLFDRFTAGDVSVNRFFDGNNDISAFFQGWNDGLFGVRGLRNASLHNFSDGGLFYGYKIQAESAYGHQTYGVDHVNIHQVNGLYNTGESDLQQISNVDPVTDSHDRALRYLVRMEENSNHSDIGVAGQTAGAHIITWLGQSGRLYGETGYDQETHQPMWPIPWQHIIQEKMAAYHYTGPLHTAGDGQWSSTETGMQGTLSGARGFAVEGQTLSNYIWGYLGELVPPFNVDAVSSQPGQLHVMWQRPADQTLEQVSGYAIYRQDDGSEPVQLATISDPQATMVQLSGVAAGTTHIYVTALSGQNNASSFSYQAPVTIQ